MVWNVPTLVGWVSEDGEDELISFKKSTSCFMDFFSVFHTFFVHKLTPCKCCILQLYSDKNTEPGM